MRLVRRFANLATGVALQSSIVLVAALLFLPVRGNAQNLTSTDICATGMCVAAEPQSGSASCRGNEAKCSGRCVSTATDPLNCGACGRVCSSGKCSNGACVAGAPQCTRGQARCGGRCATLANDPLNCGACGRVCSSGKCSNGACVSTTGGTQQCKPGQAMCAGTCANITNDRYNCGACGRVCGNGLTCIAGNCAKPKALLDDVTSPSVLREVALFEDAR